jgi:hypothetical protein
MKYIRFFWIIASILFIVPFLGVPQSFKDVITIGVALVIGFFAWIRTQTLRHKKELLELQAREKNIVHLQ